MKGRHRDYYQTTRSIKVLLGPRLRRVGPVETSPVPLYPSVFLICLFLLINVHRLENNGLNRIKHVVIHLIISAKTLFGVSWTVGGGRVSYLIRKGVFSGVLIEQVFVRVWRVKDTQSKNRPPSQTDGLIYFQWRRKLEKYFRRYIGPVLHITHTSRLSLH